MLKRKSWEPPAKHAGVLKRKRGTPMPPLAYLSGKILHSGVIALLLVAIITVFGKAFYAATETPRYTQYRAMTACVRRAAVRIQLVRINRLTRFSS